MHFIYLCWFLQLVLAYSFHNYSINTALPIYFYAFPFINYLYSVSNGRLALELQANGSGNESSVYIDLWIKEGEYP